MHDAKPMKTPEFVGYSILFSDDWRKPFVGKQGQTAVILHPDGQRTELVGARVIQQFADQNNLCAADRRTLQEVPTYYHLGELTFRVRTAHWQDETGKPYSALDIDVEGRVIPSHSDRDFFLVEKEHIETIETLLAAGSGAEVYQFLREHWAEQEEERYQEWRVEQEAEAPELDDTELELD